jgi:hypothetical protein
MKLHFFFNAPLIFVAFVLSEPGAWPLVSGSLLAVFTFCVYAPGAD